MSEWFRSDREKLSDELRALVAWDKIHRWVVLGVFVSASGKWHDDHTDEPFHPQPTHYMPLPEPPKP